MTVENSASTESSWWSVPGQFVRREFLPILTDLRLAIALLLIIAVFSVSGTVIEQGQSLAFYQANYPEHPALFGFLTWKVIQVVGLDHVYRTWWFLALLILFGTSLSACTFTRQLPALKTARRWQYYQEPRQFQKLALSAELDTGSLNSLSQILHKRRYKVFQEKAHILYARKGIVGRIGPIVVHVGIVAILLGGILGAMTGFIAQEMVASGNTFKVKNVMAAGPWANTQVLKDWSVKVNRFWIDYTTTGSIDQFYSDMSVLDSQEKEVDRQKIFVNQPLRYHGVTLYQADWGIAAVSVQFNNSPIFKLPMASLNTNGRERVWGSWIPTTPNPDLNEGVSLIAKDLLGTVLIYDATGKLLDTVRTGMSTQVNGVTLKILDVIGSTGLQIKCDPGIPLVYLGFAVLMLGTVMSYFSHSQIWALSKGDRLYVGGKTNRAHVAFEQEVLEILQRLSSQPEEKKAQITESFIVNPNLP